MKRIKKHRIKTEKPETSTSNSQPLEDYDLAYYIHDRVELMHQVFSVLKHKDLKAMAPECVRHISIDDLQELCTEELLGISSKRLCAMLDGAEPPSDTESSSASPPARLETISLDSISSDDGILNQGSGKRSRKHKHHHRSKSRRSGKSAASSEAEASRASHAGLTVLELLELQARARAIRAQLQKEQAAKKESPTVAESVPSDHDDIEIKEEPATAVVEISSDEEVKLEPGTETSANAEPTNDSGAITKRRNNLIITVPKSKQTRKIKLNRSKATVTVPNNETVAASSVTVDNPKTAIEVKETNQIPEKSESKPTIKSVTVPKEEPTKEKAKKKTKKKGKKKNADKEGSDHDEITLQLSDTEKMDLLEDLDRKNFDKLSSSSSEDSESSSSDSGSESQEETIADKPPVKETVTVSQNKDENRPENAASVKEKDITSHNKSLEQEKLKEEVSDDIQVVEENTEEQNTPTASLKVNEEITAKNDESNEEIDSGNSNNTEDSPIKNVSVIETTNITEISLGDVTDKDKSNSCIVINEDVVAKMSKKLIDANTSQNTVINVENDSPVVVVTNESENIVVTQKEIVVKETETVKFLEVSRVEDIPLVIAEPLKAKNEATTSKEVINIPVEEVDGDCTTIEKVIDLDQSPRDTCQLLEESTEDCIITENVIDLDESSKDKDTCQIPETSTENIADKNLKQVEPKELSDGEISEKASSEVEAFEPKPEVVCISDDDAPKKASKKKKKKEKKHKKEKKEKKSKSKKSKKDFCECGDQNFYKDTTETAIETKETAVVAATSADNDDVYEILELSDDSSCYEVEGTVLSKEPTAEEIEALSAKIDEIEREEVVTEQEIKEHEQREMEKNSNNDDLEEISWKDRYLDSNKVKKVLSTSGIFNALRKKNRELKKKLEESKKKDEVEEVETVEMPAENTIENLEDGSIEQFNALQGSSKYVDPVPEITEEEVATKDGDETKTDELPTEITPVTKEMKKDAKQLLKMYKRLLKYNDVTKQKDPSKKKKKSKKKSKEAGVASTKISGV